MKALLLIAAAVLAHEAGHYLTARAFGLRVRRCGFSWWPLGFYIVRETGLPVQNALISVAGPLANLLLAGSLIGGSPEFALYSLVLGLSNLAPFPYSDGRRALRCLRQVRRTA